MRFETEHGSYELNPFPGCRSLVISNKAHIDPDKRGKGLGKQQHEERIKKAKELGYDAIIATVDAKNETERHILQTHGWHRQCRFLSSKTGHLVEVWFRLLLIVLFLQTTQDGPASTFTPRGEQCMKCSTHLSYRSSASLE